MNHSLLNFFNLPSTASLWFLLHSYVETYKSSGKNQSEKRCLPVVLFHMFFVCHAGFVRVNSRFFFSLQNQKWILVHIRNDHRIYKNVLESKYASKYVWNKYTRIKYTRTKYTRIKYTQIKAQISAYAAKITCNLNYTKIKLDMSRIDSTI